MTKLPGKDKKSRVKDPSRGVAETRGRVAESRAALLLRVKGYRILGRRIRTPVGEIDLLARRGRLLAIVEVKARARTSDALESLTWRQRQRIERASEWLISRQPEWAVLDRRFDLVTLGASGWPRHLPDAWRPGLA